MKALAIFCCFFFAVSVCLIAQDKVVNSVVKKYTPKLNEIFEVQEQVKQIHPVLKKVYPVAVVEEGQYYIFEPNDKGKYVFAKQAPVKMEIPQGIKAAFPLPENDNKMTCVVTGDAFVSLDGYAFIFHEFVHCTQFESVERELKSGLRINKAAMEKQNYMWELNFGFPYEDKGFVENYSSFLLAVESNNYEAIELARKKLKETLGEEDYSYMTWVEWKEGFARWVENKIRAKLGIKENFGGNQPPFNRVTFYYGGSHLIDFYFKQNPDSVLDLVNLFSLIKK